MQQATEGPDYQYQRLYLPRGTDRRTAQSVLTAHAEYGHWELARLRLYPDGSRRVVLRRRIQRQSATIAVAAVR